MLLQTSTSKPSSPRPYQIPSPRRSFFNPGQLRSIARSFSSFPSLPVSLAVARPRRFRPQCLLLPESTYVKLQVPPTSLFRARQHCPNAVASPSCLDRNRIAAKSWTSRCDANRLSIQVLRYSALAFGIFYGFTHQRSINASLSAAAEKREYEHKQHLIEQAKAEYTKKKNPASAASTSGGCK